MNRDLYTGNLIKGKRKRDRELMLFQDRFNLLNYFKENPDKTYDISLKLFENRKKQKELIYAPSTVELRSSILPTVTLLKRNNIDYKELCDKVNLINKYNYNINPKFNNNIIDIWIDTREQHPLKIRNAQVKTLNFGDYSNPKNPNVVIERKNINDFVSSISKGYDRIKKELERAAENDVVIILLVETILHKALSFNDLPQMRFSQASPDFIFSRVKALIQEFPNFQIGFVDGRTEMIRIINRIYNYIGDINSVDLQYLIDCKLI